MGDAKNRLQIHNLLEKNASIKKVLLSPELPVEYLFKPENFRYPESLR